MPRDDKGRFIPLECPDPNCDGKLHFEADIFGGGDWRCYGLVIPADDHAKLEACPFSHRDGEPYEAQAMTHREAAALSDVEKDEER